MANKTSERINFGKIKEVIAPPNLIEIQLDDEEVLLELGRAREQFAAGVEDHRPAIEDQFVLAADLVEIKHRNVVFGSPGAYQFLADVLLVGPIGRVPVSRGKQHDRLWYRHVHGRTSASSLSAMRSAARPSP